MNLEASDFTEASFVIGGRTMKTCLIIGAGDFSKVLFLKEFEKIKENCLLIACDGGLEYLLDLNIRPDLLIGDMDSVSEQSLKEASERWTLQITTLPKEKDDTDVLAAIRHGLQKKIQSFIFFGVLGNRQDHSYANICLLSFLKNNHTHGLIVGRNEYMEVIEGETKKFQKDKKGILSVFSVTDVSEGVFLKGLKYELEDTVITSDFPIGVSNEFIGEESFITVKKGRLLLIYQQ
jgi:thiamine pyrophosphokinase